MGEVGCLKDGHFQNLQVGGTTILSGTISGLYSADTIAVVATASNGVAVTGSVTITQPANTFIRNMYIINQTGSAVTIGGNATDAGITLQVGIAANTDLIFGPAAATATTGNIIDAATANDPQSWADTGVGTLINNMVGSGADAHVLLHADLDSISAVLSIDQTTSLFTESSRDLVCTVTSFAATQANTPITAATWRLLIEYSPVV